MKRLIAYSHDTYGRSNIRSMFAVCNHLVEAIPDLSILLLSGAPMDRRNQLKNGIDYINLPTLPPLEAEGKTIGAELAETVELRSNLILHATSRFKPDLLLVDKNPFGVENELRETVSYLRSYWPETKLALLLRDMLDAPRSTIAVWQKNGYLQGLGESFDRVFVAGAPSVFDVNKEYSLPSSLAQRVRYCGYMGQSSQPSRRSSLRAELKLKTDKLVLVSAGGGADGYELMINFLAGLQTRQEDQPFDSLIVCGPEMAPSQRAQVERRAADCAHVRVAQFVEDMRGYMDCADVVVAMGGYNTICELLSLQKPAVIVPRAKPLEAQWIRAQRMANLGLFTVIHPDQLTPATLSGAVRELVRGNGRQTRLPGIDLDALPRLTGHIDALLNPSEPETRSPRLAQGNELV